MPSFDFTAELRSILVSARDAAAERGHEYVGTEHLLLGALRERNGTAAEALLRIGADLDALVAVTDAILKPGNSQRASDEELPYTSRAKKVLELAMMSARDHERSDVDPIFLLHGLIREKVGIAAQVLGDAGVTPERLPQLRHP